MIVVSVGVEHWARSLLGAREADLIQSSPWGTNPLFYDPLALNQAKAGLSFSSIGRSQSAQPPTNRRCRVCRTDLSVA